MRNLLRTLHGVLCNPWKQWLTPLGGSSSVEEHTLLGMPGPHLTCAMVANAVRGDCCVSCCSAEDRQAFSTAS